MISVGQREGAGNCNRPPGAVPPGNLASRQVNNQEERLVLLKRLLLAVVTAMTCVTVAYAQNPITIGFGMALTGGLAPNGKAALLAMQIWEETSMPRAVCSGAP